MTDSFNCISISEVLNLIIKQVYFDQIIAGTKTQEFREVKPTNLGKVLEKNIHSK